MKTTYLFLFIALFTFCGAQMAYALSPFVNKDGSITYPKETDIPGITSPLNTSVQKTQAQGMPFICSFPVRNVAAANKQVPAVVQKVFTQTFGRTPTLHESKYWKLRARCDKQTETKLLDTMKFFSAKGWTYAK